MILLLLEPEIAAMKPRGGDIETHAQPHALCYGYFIGSGEIERLTEFDAGLHGHHTFDGDEVFADPLIMDERNLATKVRGYGNSVLSACSHAGIVNTGLSAWAEFPDVPVDVVLDGYHLAGKVMEQRNEAAIDNLSTKVRPLVVASGHCTGWRAKARVADAFAPDRCAPCVVGMLYPLLAE